MIVEFLGSGAAWCNHQENYHSNILIYNDDKKFLYDAGTTINDALNDSNYEVNDIDEICISHMHSDHVGGIEYIAFKNYFSSEQKNITLLSINDMSNKIWNSFKESLAYIKNKEVELNEYFDIKEIKAYDTRLFDGIEITPIPSNHINENDSYGLFIKQDKKVYISGDCNNTNYDKNKKYYNAADIIFHECEFSIYPDSVHYQYRFLEKLPSKIKNKMFLYHYSLIDTYEELNKKVIQDGFKGLVRRAEVFDIKELL